MKGEVKMTKWIVAICLALALVAPVSAERHEWNTTRDGTTGERIAWLFNSWAVPDNLAYAAARL